METFHQELVYLRNLEAQLRELLEVARSLNQNHRDIETDIILPFRLSQLHITSSMEHIPSTTTEQTQPLVSVAGVGPSPQPSIPATLAGTVTSFPLTGTTPTPQPPTTQPFDAMAELTSRVNAMAAMMEPMMALMTAYMAPPPTPLPVTMATLPAVTSPVYVPVGVAPVVTQLPPVAGVAAQVSATSVTPVTTQPPVTTAPVTAAPGVFHYPPLVYGQG